MTSEQVQWFSTKVRLLALVEGGGTSQVADSIHVFRSTDWDAAFERALQIGQSHEREYRNAEGARVRWRLHSVVTLDAIDTTELDGAEVHSMFTDVTDDLRVAFDAALTPGTSRPSQSI
jgi:hypothetical protein